MATILDQIVAAKRRRLDQVRRTVPLEELRRRVADAPVVRSFLEALRAGSTVRVIAEIKRGSPSAGVIRTAVDAAAQARTYEAAGAAAISVLTEEDHFRGSVRDLANAVAATAVPVLRKDFLFDPYQVYEARAAGASSVLLIAEVLQDDALLHDLICLSRELGMEPLVEVYEERNVARVLDAGAQIVGVNNRNLRTFEVDLSHTARIAALVPETTLLVAESGIWSRADVETVAAAGAHAVLVGEALMRAPDPAQLIQDFSGVPRNMPRSGTADRDRR